MEGNDIKLVDLKTNTTSTLVSLSDIQDESGNPLAFYQWKLSPDMEYLLVKANQQKVPTSLVNIIKAVLIRLVYSAMEMVKLW